MSRLVVRMEKLARALTTRPRAVGELRRVVIMHNLLLGDTILLAPLLKAIEQLAPHAERFVLTRPAFLPLFEGRPYGTKALEFSRRDPASQRRLLDTGPYDLALIPDDNRYAWMARACGAKQIHGFANDRPAWKNWMIDEAMDYPSVPTAWADMLASLAGSPQPSPYKRGEWPAPSYGAFEVPPAPYVVLHVGASTPLKTWPAQRWQLIAARLRRDGLKVIWSGAASEEAIVDAIAPPHEERTLFGRLDLAQLWHLLSEARALVCPDTGIAHLARIVGVPTVAIFGPGSATIHGAGSFWAESAFEAATMAEFPCRDQNLLYRRQINWVRRCGRSLGSGSDQCSMALCMAAVSEDQVWNALKRLL